MNMVKQSKNINYTTVPYTKWKEEYAIPAHFDVTGKLVPLAYGTFEPLVLLTAKALEQHRKSYPIALPEVVIAGGLLRDAVFNTGPKDVDIFVLAGPDEDNPSDTGLRCIPDGKNITEALKDDDNYSHNVESAENEFKVFDSFDFVDFAAENVPQEQQYWANTQFIVRKEKDVESLLDSFDYDLCRIAYRPSTDEIIFYKEAFDKVIKTKKFTFPNEASYDRALSLIHI